MARKRAAILISGRGSNMAALIEAAADPIYPAEIVLVVSSDPNAAGLARAAAAGIATAVVDARKFAGVGGRSAFEAALTALVRESGTDIVCLAGFMRILSPAFVGEWQDRLINIHPSLLPSFPGLDTHARALEGGVKIHGCTVHYVRAEVDAGPIIAQAAVPVANDDTPDALAARVLEAEHRLYPAALALVASGRVHISGVRVTIDRTPAPGPVALFSPAPTT